MWHLIGRSVGTHLSLCVCLLDCWLHIESSWYHYPWCMLGYYIRLRHWHVDYIDWSFWLSSHIDSPCCMITLLILACTLFLLLISFTLTWLILLVVYYFDYHGACYHCQIFFSINLCVDLDDIYLFCMTVCCMTSLIPCDCMSCLSMWDTHLSPYFQVPSLGRYCFRWSRIWYETFCFVCFSTELVIKSRV